MALDKELSTYIEVVAKRSKKYLSVVQTKGDRCWYCGTQLSNDWNLRSYGVLDHVEPKSKRGSNSVKNLVPSCRHCNLLKGDKSLEEFREYLRVKQCSTTKAVNFLRSALSEVENDRSFQKESESIQSAIDSLESRVSKVVFFGESGGMS